MLAGAFSGTLLDADFFGGSGPPSFLGTTPSAGAACDPAAFFISEADADNSLPLPTQQHLQLQPRQQQQQQQRSPLGAGGSAGPQRPAHLQHQLQLQQQPAVAASARDLLTELESSADYLLPSSGPDFVDGLLLGDAPHPTNLMASDGSGHIGIDTGSGSLPWHSLSFPTIPEETELPQAQSQLLPSPTSGVNAATATIAAAPLKSQQLLPAQTGGAGSAPAPPRSIFIPVPSAIRTGAAAKLTPTSPVSAIDADHASGGAHSSAHSEAASPTASSGGTSVEGEDPQQPGSARGGAGGGNNGAMPRIVSMPNLHLSLEDDWGAGATPRARRGAGAGGRAMLRSRSHGNLDGGHGHGSTGDLQKYNVPHLPFLTPPHLRKGKGGRQPASDPRLDPRIDPKKARRIMANRLSAAKSKLKQKSGAQVERQRSEMQRLQEDHLMPDAEIEAEAEDA